MLKWCIWYSIYSFQPVGINTQISSSAVSRVLHHLVLPNKGGPCYLHTACVNLSRNMGGHLVSEWVGFYMSWNSISVMTLCVKWMWEEIQMKQAIDFYLLKTRMQVVYSPKNGHDSVCIGFEPSVLAGLAHCIALDIWGISELHGWRVICFRKYHQTQVFSDLTNISFTCPFVMTYVNYRVE